MKFSKAWLDEWLSDSVEKDTLVKKFNQSGLEVDSVTPASIPLAGIKVAKVVACEKHPDAKKLSVCTVSLGSGEPQQVVCGAENVREGLTVAFATIGAKFPKEDGNVFEIKQAKLRGVDSFGMICSAEELGLAESSEGILELPESFEVGQDLAKVLGLPDEVIELELTPNRADCLGMRGLAREVGAICGVALAPHKIESVKDAIDDTLPVKISSSAGCTRYSGRVIRGIDLNRPTPVWMTERLRRSGIRSIHPVVDVTNYVMLELGQPMHAFDLAKLTGGIEVRLSRKGEKLQTLDEKELTLDDATLLIADDSQPLALAGIMGGLSSAVETSTSDIFLESAHFQPGFQAGKARRYGLHTDSSHRFERGVDPAMTVDAIERATQLILEIAGGKPGPVIDVKSADFDAAGTILELRHPEVKRILGVDIPAEVITGIFDKLHFSPKYDAGQKAWQVTAPSFRFDIAIEADLIEEVARLYGYDNIDPAVPKIAMSGKPVPERRLCERSVYDFMVATGYLEVISYSFVDPNVQKYFAKVPAELRLANPISSDLSEMRSSLWPGLIQAVKYNEARQQSVFRFFESGLCFDAEGSTLHQVRRIAGVVAGFDREENWADKPRPIDFFDVKGDVEGLLKLSKHPEDFSFEAAEVDCLHPGQSCVVKNKTGAVVGRLGLLHPALLKPLDVKGPVGLFEIDWSLFDDCSIPAFAAVSRFPTIRRDLALLVEGGLPVANLLGTIRKAASDELYNCFVFDSYQGKGIPDGKKSIAIGIQLHSLEKTFTDDEIQSIMERILHALKAEHQAELRE